METTEQENINNAVSKALTEFSEKLKESTILNLIKEDSPNWYDILIQTIDKIMGNFNHRPREQEKKK